MRRAIVVAGIQLLTVSLACAQEGLANVRWCETQTAPPAQVRCQVRVMPDRQARLLRSAAELIAQSRAAARAGRDDEAIAWAMECQCHNASAIASIVRDRNSVLRYLK